MNTDFEYSIFNEIVLIVLLIVLIAVKFYYFRILRPGSTIKRFLKSCFRWYGSNERDLTYDHPRKRKFMIINNWTNIPFWALLTLLVIKIIMKLITVLPDEN